MLAKLLICIASFNHLCFELSDFLFLLVILYIYIYIYIYLPNYWLPFSLSCWCYVIYVNIKICFLDIFANQFWHCCFRRYFVAFYENFPRERLTIVPKLWLWIRRSYLIPFDGNEISIFTAFCNYFNFFGDKGFTFNFMNWQCDLITEKISF